MKRLLLTAVCVSVLSSGILCAEAKPFHADADNRPRHEMKMHDDLADRLKLTDEQKAQADRIREDGRKKMEPLMQERRALHERMEKLRKENMEEFEKILTPEQKEEFAKLKQHRGPRQGRPPLPRDHHLKAKEVHHADGVLPMPEADEEDLRPEPKE